MNDLEKELIAREKKIAALKRQIKEKKDAEQRRALQAAEKKQPTAAEIEMLKAAFSKFDKDNSGSISLTELQALSKELGVGMTDADAAQNMKELDKNGDGTLSFAEFSDWWAADSSRGGNKGLRLKLLRRRLEAVLLREDATARLKRFAKAEGNAVAEGVPMSVETSVKVGEPGEEPKSTISVIALPQDAARFAAFVQSTEWLKETPNVRYVVEVTMSVRDGADADKVDDLCKTSTSVMQVIKEMSNLDGSVTFNFDAEAKVVNLRFVMTVEDADNDPFADQIGVLDEVTEKRGLEAIFGSLTASVSFRESIGDTCTWNVDAPRNTDLLDNSHVLTSTRFNRNLSHALIQDLSNGDEYRSQKQKKLVRLLALNMFDGYQSSHTYESTDAVRQRILASICSAPLARMQEIDPPLKPESEAELLNILKTWKDRSIKLFREAEFINKVSLPFLLAEALPEDLLEVTGQVPGSEAVFALLPLLHELKNIAVQSPIVGGRVAFSGFPVFDLFKDISTPEALSERAKQYKKESTERLNSLKFPRDELDKLGEKIPESDHDRLRKVGDAIEGLKNTLEAMSVGLTGEQLYVVEPDQAVDLGLTDEEREMLARLEVMNADSAPVQSVDVPSAAHYDDSD